MSKSLSSPTGSVDELANRFREELNAVIAQHDIYRDVDRALGGYFATLQRHVQPRDFSGAESLVPGSGLGLYVNRHILHSWLGAWLRSQGVDPDVFTPIR